MVAWGVALCLTGCVDLFERPTARPPVDAAIDGPPVDRGPDAEPDAAPVCLPITERCNGVDDDCDGETDERVAGLGGPCTAGDGACAVAGVIVCGGAEGPICDAAPRSEAAADERCNGVDDDCDGATDEDFGVICCGPDDAGPPCNGCPAGSHRPPAGWVCIPAGEFEMGHLDPDSDLHPDARRHHVILSDPLWMMDTEVTRAGWAAVVGGDPAHRWLDAPSCREDARDLCPVQRVSWFDAVWFAHRAAEAAGLAPCYDGEAFAGCVGEPGEGCPGERLVCDGGSGAFDCRGEDGAPLPEVGAVALRCPGLRLPTEAEWEYANRAGAGSLFSSGDHVDDLGAVAWYADNSGMQPQRVAIDKRQPPAHPAALEPPDVHRWGLHDMHGNVAEWVQDGYAQYPDGSVSDPLIADVEAKVVRGGHYASGPTRCMSAARASQPPDWREASIGFRLVRPVVPMAE